jgi:hypothetical protein
MIHRLTIENWHPCTTNQLVGWPWPTVYRRKKADQRVVGIEALAQRIPKATCKRRVHLHLLLGPRGRPPDPDSPFKSLLDSLVAAGLLVDDSPKYVELAPMSYERGTRRAAVITLEDLPEPSTEEKPT